MEIFYFKHISCYCNALNANTDDFQSSFHLFIFRNTINRTRSKCSDVLVQIRAGTNGIVSESLWFQREVCAILRQPSRCVRFRFRWFIFFRFGSYVGRLRQNKGPFHTYPVLFENGDFFFSGLASFSHVFGENGHQKRSFQKQSLERRFLKTLATHLRLDGRKRRNTTSFTSFTTSITRVL